MHHSLPEAKNLHGMKKSDIQTLCYQTGGKVVITIAILTVENITTQIISFMICMFSTNPDFNKCDTVSIPVK